MFRSTFSFLIVFSMLSRNNCEEPQCSKFHYEAQMLEKMIRMEIKVETMEKEIMKTNQQVLQSLQELKIEREQLKSEWNVLSNDYAENKAALKQSFEEMKGLLLSPTYAFKAREVTDTSPETGQTIVFPTTMFNEGGGYDNVTGIFTVPVAGTYLFTVHICVQGSYTFYYGIVVDNIVQTSGRFYEDGSTACHTADAILVLERAQKVWVKCLSGSTTAILYEYSSSTYNFWNSFSGVLIHK